MHIPRTHACFFFNTHPHTTHARTHTLPLFVVSNLSDPGMGGPHGLHPLSGGAPDVALRHVRLGRHERQAVGLGEAVGLHAGVYHTMVC